MSDIDQQARAPLRALHVLPWISGGGVERRRLELAKFWQQSGSVQIHIACLTAPNAKLRQELQAHGAEVHTFGSSRRGFAGLIAASMGIARLVRAWRPHIIHGAVFEGNLMAVAAARLAHVRRSAITILEETSEPSNRRRRGTLLLRLAARRAERFVAVSAAVEDYLVGTARIPPEKVVLIENGVTTPSRPSPGELHRLREALGLSKCFVVGVAGRLLDDHKRVSDLIQAVAVARRQSPDLHLLVVGDGPDRRMLEQLAREQSVPAIFTGHVHEMGHFYSLMDCMCLSSDREAFGLVIVEAMFCGVPVIATDTGGARTIIENSITGTIVPRRSPDAIAAAINELRRNPQFVAHSTAAALDRVTARFSGDAYARRVHGLYSALHDGRRSSDPVRP